MDKMCAQRVLVENERLAADLQDLEAAELTRRYELGQAATAATGYERQQLEHDEQRQLARIEGLVIAQLALTARRQAFSRAHVPGLASWKREAGGTAAGADL
jgi:hypothetical protein